MATTRATTQVKTLAELQTQPFDASVVVWMLCKAAMDDNMGGFYWWDPTSTAAVDNQYLTVIASTVNGSAPGRWIRLFQRTRTLPHGTLIYNGNVKRFIATGVTASDGTVTTNLTMDGTANGTPIFSEIWDNAARATSDAATLALANQSYKKTTATNLKSTTHQFYRANAVTFTLGLLYTPFAGAPAGIATVTVVEGI